MKILDDNERGQARVEGNELIVESKIPDAAAVRVGAPVSPESGGGGKLSFDDVTKPDSRLEIGKISVGNGIFGPELKIALLKKGGASVDGDMIDLLQAWATGIEFLVPVKMPNPIREAVGSFLQNGRYQLHVQGDGNLVLYDTSVEPWKALWSSGTPQPQAPIPFPPAA